MLSMADLLNKILKLKEAFAKGGAEKIKASCNLISDHLISIEFETICSRFEGERHGNKMFQFISKYLKMYERLLTFIYASRSRNW